jgi:hypothetical protein
MIEKKEKKRGCSARFPLHNIRSLTVSTAITTRSMAQDTRHATRACHTNRKAVCHGDLLTRKSSPARKPHLQFSALHSTHDDPNLTMLQRTGINAAPLDWLPEIIVTHCQTVIERYEELISKADEDIVLDGVRRAFNLVKAQACMLATLSIPAIQEFLLPELRNARHNVLRNHKGLATSHNVSRVDEAVEEVDMAIMFFEDLIKDVVDHCKILEQSD